MKEKSIRNKSIKAGDKVFDIVNTLLLVFIFLIILYPLYYVVIASFSDPDLVLTGKIFLLPKGFQLDSYKKVFSNSEVMNGYMHTIMYAAVGTCINLAVTLTAGYALSRPDLRGRKGFTLFFVFTMFFGGGTVPTYMFCGARSFVPWAGGKIIADPFRPALLVLFLHLPAASPPFMA